jgi:hypothetical protein
MRQTILLLCLITVLLNSACRFNGNSAQQNALGSAKKNSDSIPVPVLTGNDADSKGCKGSAGYSWSALRKECIRPWENGIAFLKTKEGQTTAAYLILSVDKRNAELFCSESEIPSLLSVSFKRTDKGLLYLFEDAANRWALVNDAGKYLLQSNGETLYRLPDSSVSARAVLAAIGR